MALYIEQNDIRKKPFLLEGFFSLAKQSFGIDFRPWYQSGWWKEGYIPHCLCRGDEVLANVSVNPIEFLIDGEKRLYVQLGTVMTRQEERGKGHARALMEHVLETWRGRCDLMYLFANDSVLDFYPRFGFEKRNETKTVLAGGWAGDVFGLQKVNMEDAGERQGLISCVERSAPQAEATMVNNPGLIMFYLDGFMKESIYYLKRKNAYVVLEKRGETLCVLDVFCKEWVDIWQLCTALPSLGPVELGFSPLNWQGGKRSIVREDDSTLFVLPIKEDWREDLRFPVLSHA